MPSSMVRSAISVSAVIGNSPDLVALQYRAFDQFVVLSSLHDQANN
jgi:hypothetical protein